MALTDDIAAVDSAIQAELDSGTLPPDEAAFLSAMLSNDLVGMQHALSQMGASPQDMTPPHLKSRTTH